VAVKAGHYADMMRPDGYHARLRCNMRKVNEGNCTVIYGAFDPEEAQECSAPLGMPVQTDLGSREAVILSGPFHKATELDKLTRLLLNGFALDTNPVVMGVVVVPSRSRGSEGDNGEQGD
jgi:hypothetical protein